MRSIVLLLATITITGLTVHFCFADEPFFGHSDDFRRAETRSVDKQPMKYYPRGATATPVPQESKPIKNRFSAADTFGTHGAKAIRKTSPTAAQPTTQPQTYRRTGTQAELTPVPRRRDYYTELFGKRTGSDAQANPESNRVQTAQWSTDRVRANVRPVQFEAEETLTPIPEEDPFAAHEKNLGSASSPEAEEPDFAAFFADDEPVERKAEPKTSLPFPNEAAGVPATRSPQNTSPLAKQASPFETRPAADPVEPAAPRVTIAPTPAQRDAIAARPTRFLQSVARVTDGPQTASVEVSWVRKSELNLNQECDFELHVKNVGKATAHGVSVDATLPQTAKVTGAKPAPSSHAETVPNSHLEKLHWNIGSLPAGKTEIISLTMIPTVAGGLGTEATVRFSGVTTNTFSVKEPKLDIALAGTARALIGEPVTQHITITNPGTGITRNIQIEAAIPKGLEHRHGEVLSMDVGSLNPGESRKIRLSLATVAGGKHSVIVTATAENELSASAESAIEVLAPTLEAKITGPALRYKGRNAKYTLTVNNPGTVATSNVRMLHKVPKGMKYISANRGASYDRETQILSWFVGRLEAGKSAAIEVVLQAEDFGKHTHHVRATSEMGTVADGKMVTKVDGVPSLVLDIADVDDPVEVGVETAYVITVKNEGSMKATNVGVSCELPKGIQYLDAEGPTAHLADADLVVFKPIASLAPGESSKFQVKFKGLAEGSLRMRVQLSSDSAPDPLTYEELTRFYDGTK